MIPKKTNKIRIAIILVLVLLGSASLVFAKTDLQITLKIVDEDGVPVDNARIEMTYLIRLNWKSETLLSVGNADSKGNFIASAVADDTTWFSVTKDGYYPSSGDYKFKEIKSNRWEPWNPEVRVVLKKKIHPVAMYARDTKSSKLVIPDIDKPIGFDLTMFDWVTPYGKGIYSDFIVKLEGQYSTEMNYDMMLTLTFANKFDGIQAVKESLSGGSQLKLARIAPHEGYQAKLVKYRKWTHQKTLEDNFEGNNNYYFRIRSEVKDNKLLRAMYGKILGDIQFYPINSNSAKIIFKYYLTPDYTQNIEYDPQQNLFLELRDRRSLEWVGLE